MARGMTREQLGVTDAMLRAYGETVFRMSHNVQQREGDPVRRLDYSEIERQREAMGLSDRQIAERIGLTRDQVMFIRNSEESRRFRTGQQAYLLELGGGRRYRAERDARLEERFRYSADALRLRAAFGFDPERARAYIAAGWWRDDTVSRWLARRVAERPQARALVSGETTLSWSALAQCVARVAEGLRRVGVTRGDVVAVQLPNVPEFVLTYFALCRLGAVISTVHMPYRGAEIEALLRHSRARAVVCSSRTKDWAAAEAYLALRETLPSLQSVIAVGPAVDGAHAFSELAQAPALDARALPEPVAADPFLLLYTSGTTSAPKGVPHNYHTLLSNARLGVPEHGLGADDRILSAAPFTHLFGLYSLHCALAAGATSVLLPAFSPPELAATIARNRPSALWTAPAHVAACRAAGLLGAREFSSLKLAIMSGSTCPPELVHHVAETLPDCRVTQLWGMTETQGALYTRPGDALEVSAHSAGKPSPGTEVRVVDAEARACAPGIEGELQVRGCLLFPGFYDNDAANAGAFTAGGWYRTGDLAVTDAAGNVTITGRLKDVINRGGHKFNPRDVETLLDSHPAVLQSAIVPMPDAVLGERACCFVTLRPGAQAPTLEALCAYLLARDIAKMKLPERLVVLDEMPLTPTRKIIKTRLRIPS